MISEYVIFTLNRHDNGDVVFWQSGSTGLKKIFTWSTGDVFENSGKWIEESQSEITDDIWPPFRKVIRKYVVVVVGIYVLLRHISCS